MTRLFAKFGRVGLTMVFVAAATIVGWNLWIYYEDQPWTRDGRVDADVVQVTPDVSGLVQNVVVKDNEWVHVGQILFQVDPARFELAMEMSKAVVQQRTAAFMEARRETSRYQQLTNLSVSTEQQQQRQSTADQAAAALQQAIVDEKTARLNLDRSNVRASVNGYITNFALQPGDYVSSGQAVSALVDSDTFRVEGYFEETKLPRIKVGDEAQIHIMGTSIILRGRVESLANGIANREVSSSGSLLANVNPTFSWVRLAQRVPVRVALVDVPTQVHLVSGRTATVVIGALSNRSGWMHINFH